MLRRSDPALTPPRRPRFLGHYTLARSAEWASADSLRDLHAHRFWLDVKAYNTRAQALYDSEGFVEEGRLRECVKTDAGYDSLIVMSLLETEYAARQQAGREAA